METMLALRFTNRKLALADVPPPNQPSEALVRVVKSGICNTDLEIIRGYAGFEGTIGHEFIGIVEKANAAPHLIGKRVVGEINAGCGACKLCLSGDTRHCPGRTVLGIVGRDGAHAEFLNLPSQNLIEVPAEISDDQAVFTEPLAAAYGITEQVEISPETRVAVIGDGKLGLLCAISLALKSKNITIIGKHAATRTPSPLVSFHPASSSNDFALAGSYLNSLPSGTLRSHAGSADGTIAVPGMP